jgi:CheY-like chemotaxis protein
LEALGYRVLLACNGNEAVQLFNMNCGQIDLILLDVAMPDLSGPDAYIQMTTMRPDLPVVFTTGYSHEVASLNSLLEKGAPILQKPYGPTALAQMIGDVLQRLCPAKPAST